MLHRIFLVLLIHQPLVLPFFKLEGESKSTGCAECVHSFRITDLLLLFQFRNELILWSKQSKSLSVFYFLCFTAVLIRLEASTIESHGLTAISVHLWRTFKLHEEAQVDGPHVHSIDQLVVVADAVLIQSKLETVIVDLFDDAVITLVLSIGSISRLSLLL